MASADVDITARPYTQDPSAPDPHGPLPGGNAGPPTRDDLDDLFNYDHTLNDPFRDVDNADAAATHERARDTTTNDLGIDAELKIRKPRRPIAKLDETRLLSEKGIPKLRRITKERLRFRGKGHEFADVQRLLNTYQLWLDDLFPKAKFADGLALVERVGHRRGVKVARQGWIEEEKPRVGDVGEEQGGDGDFEMGEDAEGVNVEDGARGQDRQSEAENAPDEGDADGLDDEALYGRPTPQPESTGRNMQPGDEPEEDELDALLAEDASRPVQTTQIRPPPEEDDNPFADEEEAMAGMW